MPAKKAPAKKAPAAKKAAKKATSKEATPEKPAGVVKKNAAKDGATPKPARPKPTREIFGDIRKSQSLVPYSPDTDVKGAIEALTGGGRRHQPHRERAAEIFRLYGGAAVEAAGWDRTVLLNACLNIAWMEGEWSVMPDGDRSTDGTVEARFGKADLNHFADQIEWTNKMGAMQRAMEALLVKDQTERANAFWSIGPGNVVPPRHMKGTEEERERQWQEAKELAMYYKNHPDEGHSVPGKKSASRSPAKKEAVGKAAAPASATKKTPTAKKTSVAKASTVKKATTASTTEAGVMKAPRAKTRAAKKVQTPSSSSPRNPKFGQRVKKSDSPVTVAEKTNPEMSTEWADSLRLVRQGMPGRKGFPSAGWL